MRNRGVIRPTLSVFPPWPHIIILSLSGSRTYKQTTAPPNMRVSHLCAAIPTTRAELTNSFIEVCSLILTSIGGTAVKMKYMTFKGIIIHWRLDKTLMCKPNLEKSELHPFDPSAIIFPSSLFPPSRAISSCRISSSKSRFLGFVSGGGTGAKVLGNVNVASLPSKIWQDDAGWQDQGRINEEWLSVWLK